jgi:hypothetical protein
LLVVLLIPEHFQHIHALPLVFVSFVSKQKVTYLIQKHSHCDYNKNY